MVKGTTRVIFLHIADLQVQQANTRPETRGLPGSPMPPQLIVLTK